MKNAFQGVASSQTTLLVLFRQMMQEFKARIGIDRSASTYPEYNVAYKNSKRFLREKYNVEDIPLSQLDLPFIEAFDFNLRVDRGLTDESIVTIIALLLKVARINAFENETNEEERARTPQKGRCEEIFSHVSSK